MAHLGAEGQQSVSRNTFPYSYLPYSRNMGLKTLNLPFPTSPSNRLLFSLFLPYQRPPKLSPRTLQPLPLHKYSFACPHAHQNPPAQTHPPHPRPTFDVDTPHLPTRAGESEEAEEERSEDEDGGGSGTVG